MDPIKVLLVIEVRLIGNIFTSVLEDESDIKVTGCVATLEDALAFIQTREVDIALISADLRNQGALRFMHAVTDRSLPTKVLVLGLSEDNKNEALFLLRQNVLRG